jgi:dynein assembly factor with WDR repeat domains 1
VLRTHLLPLTNCAFNKAGDRFITGSYDRTCRVWDTASGEELLALEGHKNVVGGVGGGGG